MVVRVIVSSTLSILCEGLYITLVPEVASELEYFLFNVSASMHVTLIQGSQLQWSSCESTCFGWCLCHFTS